MEKEQASPRWQAMAALKFSDQARDEAVDFFARNLVQRQHRIRTPGMLEG